LEKIKFNPLSVERPIALDIIEFFQTNIEASNSWAVRGEYTETGQAILSNDPHLDLNIPGQWYQFIVNYTLPNGTNWVSTAETIVGNARFFGKSPYFAIAPTTSHGDNQDLFRETIEGDKYLLDGVWRDLRLRN
jgi:penicillin G amidase